MWKLLETVEKLSKYSKLPTLGPSSFYLDFKLFDKKD